MSRYSKKINNDTLAWGYDNPLQEYFIQLYDQSDECVFELGTTATLVPHPQFPSKIMWSNKEILEIFEQYHTVIPAEHIAAVKENKPF